MLYQLFTEDLNRPEITRILDSRFSSYTLIPASGRWQGISESSLVAEIDTEDNAAIADVAERIRVANNQSAVLVEAIPATASLASGMASVALPADDPRDARDTHADGCLIPACAL